MGPQPWELRKPDARSARRHPSWCFNGAAALGAAETRRGFAAVDTAQQASMGPQPWELRKPDYQVWTGQGTGSFNGAAALGAAETPSSRASQPIRRCFNGAAALGAAETVALW